MLVIKYKKLGRAKYISHLDLLRHMQRTLRRAKIDMNYSHGFNPHELIYFAPAAPLGLESVCEYMTISNANEEELFLERFNKVAILGIEATQVVEIEKNPNLAAKATYAEYEISNPSEELINKIESAFKQDVFEITFVKKRKEVTKDVRDLMLNYLIKGNKINIILAVGERSLRIDRFLKKLGENNLTNVRKTNLYVGEVSNLINADKYIEG